MNDMKILEKCMEFGRNLRFFRNKFLGLLPIINEKRLFEKRGFSSIFKFAYQVGGVSEEQVKAVLSLYFRFRDLSALKSLLVNGTVSANKLIKVASIARKENEEELCSLVLKLPYKAIETLVRDYKFSLSADDANVQDPEASNSGIQNQSGLPFASHSGFRQNESQQISPESQECHFGYSNKADNPNICPPENVSPSIPQPSSLPPSSQTLQNVNKGSQIKFASPTFAHPNANLSPNFLRAQKVFSALNEELIFRLNILLEKGLDINEILTKLLDERERQIEEKKAEISKKTSSIPAKSRYIPASVRQVVREEKGTACSYPNCKNHASVLHHTNRFALTHRHDPNFLAPLCKEHHQIAHFVDSKFLDHSKVDNNTS